MHQDKKIKDLKIKILKINNNSQNINSNKFNKTNKTMIQHLELVVEIQITQLGQQKEYLKIILVIYTLMS